MTQRQVLICGGTSALECHLAAAYLVSGEPTSVHIVVDRGAIDDLRERISATVAARASSAGLKVPDALESGLQRLHIVGAETGRRLVAAPPPLEFDTIWDFDAGRRRSGHGDPPVPPLVGGRPGAYNHVAWSSPAVGRDRQHRSKDARLAGQRRFELGFVVAGVPLPREAGGDGFEHLLAALAAFKAQVADRAPGYFDYQALRCHAPVTSIRLLRAEDAAEILIRLSEVSLDGDDRPIRIAGPEPISFADVCEALGSAHGLSLLCEQDAGRCTAVDRAFNDRLAVLRAGLVAGTDVSTHEAFRLAGWSADAAVVSNDGLTAAFENVASIQEADLAARRERGRRAMTSVARRAVDRDGDALRYCVAGEGRPPLVLLNALGQGLHYWSRLIERMARAHRLIAWEPRGTHPAPRALGIADQVADLEAVRAEEGADRCVLVAWCTGPKVAVEYHLAHPGRVAAMVFLNPTFKHYGGSPELDTTYERSFEPLCAMVRARPNLAASVMSSLRASTAPGDDAGLLDDADPDQLAMRILAAPPNDLRDEVAAPFRNEACFTRYVQQIHDFWSHDSLASAKRVDVPVLFISAEYDQVASPETSRAAAPHFPNARHVHLRGASHYALYDQPDLIANIIEYFLDRPDDVGQFDGGCDDDDGAKPAEVSWDPPEGQAGTRSVQ